MDVFREEQTSVLAGFHAGPLIYPSRIGIGSVGFCGGRKTGELREKPLEQGQNQQQSQPAFLR